jgi:hypothetical protein
MALATSLCGVRSRRVWSIATTRRQREARSIEATRHARMPARFADHNEEAHMDDDPAGPVFVILKVLSYVAEAAIIAAVVYAATMAIRYWPGIAV